MVIKTFHFYNLHLTAKMRFAINTSFSIVYHSTGTSFMHHDLNMTIQYQIIYKN